MAGCIAHARNGRISTSGEKSDVTIVFLDPDFLKDAISFKTRKIRRFAYMCTLKAAIGLLNICMGFQDLLA